MIDRKKAIAAGYTPEEIDAYENNNQGFSITDLLPMLGGIAGGSLGALGGTAIAPGVGTVGGGIAGAGAGSAGGEWLRQALNNQFGDKSTTDINYGDVATQGALGAAGEGVGQGVGLLAKGATKLMTKTLPKRMAGSVFKESIKDTKAGITKGSSLAEEALTRGEVGSTKGIYQNATTKIDEIEGGLQTLLSGSDKKVDINAVKKTVAPLVAEYTQAGNTQAAKSMLDRIAAIEEANGQQLPASLANEIKRSIYNEVNQAYGTEAAASKEGLKAIARGFKESLAEIPGVSQANKDLSYYGRLRDSMLDKMTRDERNNVLGLTDTLLGSGALAGGGLPATVGAIATKKTVGSTLGKTAIANGLNKAGNALDQIPAAVGGVAASTTGQGLTRGAASLLSPTGQPANNSTENNPSNNSFQDTSIIPQDGTISPQAAMILMAQYPKQASLIKMMYEIGQSNQKKNMSEGDIARLQTGEFVKDALAQLYQNPNIKTGPISPKIEEFKATFNAGDPSTIDFNKTIAGLQAAIAKARAGTSFTPNEERLLKQYTPQVGDSYQQLEAKLRGLQKMFGGEQPSSYNSQSQTIPMPYYGLEQ